MKIKFNRTYEAVNADDLIQTWPPNRVFDVPAKIAKKAIKAKAAISMEPAPAKPAKKAAKKTDAKADADADAQAKADADALAKADADADAQAKADAEVTE